MKKHIAFIFAGMMASGLAVASADTEVNLQDTQVSKEITKTERGEKGRYSDDAKRHDRKHHHHKHDYSNDLGLTDEQIAEIEELRKYFDENILKPSFTYERKEGRLIWFDAEKGETIDFKEELNKVFTPEQREKAAEIYQKKRKMIQERKK